MQQPGRHCVESETAQNMVPYIYSPTVGVDHDDISALAAMCQEVVCKLVRALIDLLIGEETLGSAGTRCLYDTWSFGVPFGVGGEDFMDSWSNMSN